MEEFNVWRRDQPEQELVVCTTIIRSIPSPLNGMQIVISRAYHIFRKMVDTHRVRNLGPDAIQELIESDWLGVLLIG